MHELRVAEVEVVVGGVKSTAPSSTSSGSSTTLSCPAGTSTQMVVVGNTVTVQCTPAIDTDCSSGVCTKKS